MAVRWKAILIGVLVLAATAAALVYFWPFGREAAELRLPGVVEIQEVRLGPRVAGRVSEVFVVEGEVVKPDQVLVKLQAPELDAQLTQWQRSEERRVGKECVFLCRSRWSPYH